MGDESIGHRVRSTVVGPGGATFTFYFDVVAIRQGRAVVLFLFSQSEEPWPLGEIERLGTTVMDRMTA